MIRSLNIFLAVVTVLFFLSCSTKDGIIPEEPLPDEEIPEEPEIEPADFTITWSMATDEAPTTSDVGASDVTAHTMHVGSVYSDQEFTAEGFLFSEGKTSTGTAGNGLWVGRGSSNPNPQFTAPFPQPTGFETTDMYVDFSITADQGKDLKISQIRIPLVRIVPSGGNGATLQYNLAYSLDGFSGEAGSVNYLIGAASTAIGMSSTNELETFEYDMEVVVPKERTLSLRLMVWRRNSNDVGSSGSATRIQIGRDVVISGTSYPFYEGGDVYPDQPDNDFHLYLLAGQSNMAGRGTITPEYTTVSHPRVKMLNAQNRWVPAKHPLHFDAANAGVGPGLQFAIKMAEANPGMTIGLIPSAVGGSNIDAWQPGGFDENRNVYPYDNALARTKEAMLYGVMKGILWHQGESNSGASASEWPDKVKVLVNRFRTEFNDDTLPFILGELSYERSTSHNINDRLPQLVSEVPYSAVASAAGLTAFDVTHFDSPSATTLGERYAEQMQTVQNSN